MSAIRIGNQIVFIDKICGVDYKKFAEEDASMVGYNSILMLYTADGRAIIVKNEEADKVWKWAKAQAMDLGVLKP